MTPRTSLAALGAALLALGTAACGGDSGPNTITDAEAQQVGGVLAGQMSQIAASFTVSGTTAPTPAPGFARGVLGAPPMPSSGPCPVADDLTDNDQDGVPDDATFTFNAVDCSGPGYQVTGTIRIVDPSSSPGVVGFNGTYTNFLSEVTNTQNGDFLNVEIDGSHGVLGTSAQGTLTESLITQIDASLGGQTFNAQIANSWGVAFSAGQGQALVMDQPLPDGTLTFNGSSAWDVNGQAYSFDVQTQAGLVYDAQCQSVDYPFATGEVRAHLAGEGGNVYVRILFQGCGVQPSVQLFGRNS